MADQNFTRCESDPCVYYKKTFENGEFVLMLLYVDDMLVIGTSMVVVSQLKQQLANILSMRDLGVAKQILGIKIIRDRKKKEVKLSQKKYIEKVLDRPSIKGAKAVGTPLANHFKLFVVMCRKTHKEKEYMERVP